MLKLDLILEIELDRPLPEGKRKKSNWIDEG